MGPPRPCQPPVSAFLREQGFRRKPLISETKQATQGCRGFPLGPLFESIEAAQHTRQREDCKGFLAPATSRPEPCEAEGGFYGASAPLATPSTQILHITTAEEAGLPAPGGLSPPRLSGGPTCSRRRLADRGPSSAADGGAHPTPIPRPAGMTATPLRTGPTLKADPARPSSVGTSAFRRRAPRAGVHGRRPGWRAPSAQRPIRPARRDRPRTWSASNTSPTIRTAVPSRLGPAWSPVWGSPTVSGAYGPRQLHCRR